MYVLTVQRLLRLHSKRNAVKQYRKEISKRRSCWTTVLHVKSVLIINISLWLVIFLHFLCLHLYCILLWEMRNAAGHGGKQVRENAVQFFWKLSLYAFRVWSLQIDWCISVVKSIEGSGACCLLYFRNKNIPPLESPFSISTRGVFL